MTPRLCLLLLPAKVEDLPYRERVEDLMRAPGTAAIEPARVGSMRRVPTCCATASPPPRRGG